MSSAVHEFSGRLSALLVLNHVRLFNVRAPREVA